MFSINGKKYNKSSDEELMLLIIQGNHRAFEELYKRYSKNMLYFFYQRLQQNNEKSQDFLQDLFLKVIEKANRFDSSKKFKIWLYTMAANMCKNEYRRVEVRGVQVGDFDFNELFQESSTAHLADKFDKNLFTRLLTNELSKLDENHSLTFELRYINHLSINEISTVMECSEGTVKSRLFYTIRKLSHKLEMFNPYNEAN
ncbi:MAG: RNA polymerase sigma factor [Sphingobacteriaceae bacterium]